MATAAPAKPAASLPGKLKRPTHPYGQNGVVNGIRTPQQSPAAVHAAAAANRPVGAKQTNSAVQNGTAAAVSSANGRAVPKAKKDAVRNGEPVARVQRPALRTVSLENVNGDRRQLKPSPEPYGE